MATRRTQEQRSADIGDKIVYHEKHIERLRKERESILNPPERAPKISMKTAMDALIIRLSSQVHPKIDTRADSLGGCKSAKRLLERT